MLCVTQSLLKDDRPFKCYKFASATIVRGQSKDSLARQVIKGAMALQVV